MKDKNEIGIYLRMLREENLMTQTEFAKELNIEPQTISKWETGNGYPDITLLEAIAGYYKLSLDDILECRLPEFRSTKIINQKTLFWKNELLKSIIFDGIEPIYTKALIDRYPMLKSCNLNETESLASFLSKTKNTVWTFDVSKMVFIDPKSGLSLEDDIFKVFIYVYMTPVVEQAHYFSVKKFDSFYREDILIYLAESNQLNKNLISYIAYDKHYAQKAGVKEVDMANRLHPQFSIMNELNIKYQGKAIVPNEDGFFEMIKNYASYTTHQVSATLTSDKSFVNNQMDTLKLMIENLRLEDAHESLNLLQSHFEIQPYILKYLALAIKSKRTSDIFNLVKLYRLMEYNINNLDEICYSTDDKDVIVFLIDSCGLFTNLESKLKIYADAKHLIINDFSILLVQKIAYLESLIAKQNDQIISLNKMIQTI